MWLPTESEALSINPKSQDMILWLLYWLEPVIIIVAGSKLVYLHFTCIYFKIWAIYFRDVTYSMLLNLLYLDLASHVRVAFKPLYSFIAVISIVGNCL